MGGVAMRCAIYGRRSTEEHQEASLDVQIGEAKRYIAAKGWTLVDGCTYIDDAVSRAEFKRRPGLIALLNAAEAKTFDVIVVRDETRLGGDTYRLGLLVQSILDAGVRLFYFFSGEEVTLNNAVDKVLLAVRSFASELEREKVSQRTREHLEIKARSGLNVGGRVFGYDNREVRQGDRRVRVEYAINGEQAEIVRELWRRHWIDGDGVRQLAKDLNARHVPPPRAGRRGTGSWSPSVVWSIVHSERYLGTLVWGRHRKLYRAGTKIRELRPESECLHVDVPELRIVPDDVEVVMRDCRSRKARDGTHARPPAGRHPRYLLSQLARCGCCGGPIQANNGKDGRRLIKVYVCGYHRTRGDAVCTNTTRRPVAEVDEKLLEVVKTQLLREEVVAEALRQIRQRLRERSKSAVHEAPGMEKEAGRLKVEIDRLANAIASTTAKPEALVQGVVEREQRLAMIESRLATIRTAPAVLDLEVRRMEQEAGRRIQEIGRLFEQNAEQARKGLAQLLAGPLTFMPVEVDGLPRYEISGRFSFDALFPNVRVPNGIRTRATGLKGRSPDH
jgi:site-specific DNA recombinase